MTPHSLAFYMNVIASGTVLGARPTDGPDQVTAILGSEFAEISLDSRSMWRDYGMAEFFWIRESPDHPWEGHHFTLQVHRLSHWGGSIVSRAVRDRYGRFDRHLRYEKLERLLKKRGVPLEDVPDGQAMEQERAERAAVAERARRARERALEQARQVRAEKAERLAPAVRGALKKAAREHRVTTWAELRDKTGLRQLERLNHEDKLALLSLVESDTAPEEPLWSALLVEDDMRLHRDICRLLGRPLPDSDAELIDQLTMERDRLHRQR